MRILIATDTFTPMVNGAVTSILCLKKGLEALGHEVKILTLAPGRRSYEEDGVVRLGSFGAGAVYPGARWRLCSGRRLLRALIRWKPDIIHTQNEFSTFAAAKRIAARTGAPLIHTYHTVYEEYTRYFCPSERLGRFLAARLTKQRLSRVTYVIAPTAKIRSLLYRYRVRPVVRIVPSGIDTDLYAAARPDERLRARLNIPADAPVALFVGRLGYEKNVSAVLRAFAAAGTGYLILAGDGPYRSTLEREAADSGAGDRIRFVGMVDRAELPAYYKTADAFVNASKSETQGLTVIEALASGLPVVCLDDESYRGAVADGENGFLCADEADLAEKLGRVLRDRPLGARLSARAEQSAERFSAVAFAQAVERVYLAGLEAAVRPRVQPRPVKN